MPQVMATPVSRESGVGAVLGSFLRGVGDGLRDGRIAESDTSVGDGIVELVRGLYTDSLPVRSRRAALLAADPGVDRRALHDPYAQPGVDRRRALHLRAPPARARRGGGADRVRWIRDRRLDRCRRDLADPALAGETVASIAYGWGFRNPRHFSRVYRAAYGCAPSDGRAVR